MAKSYTAADLEDIERQFEELLFVSETAVILIDKQVTLRKTIRRMLEELGVEKDAVSEADDTIKAEPLLAQCAGKRLVVVTDLNFARPQCDGLKMIAKLRQDTATAKAMILLVTDERKKERLAAAVKLGIAGCFKKPLDTAAFKEKLKELKVAS